MNEENRLHIISARKDLVRKIEEYLLPTFKSLNESQKIECHKDILDLDISISHSIMAFVGKWKLEDKE